MARNAAAYDEDYYAWTIEQASLLRAGEFSAIDVANIAEEIEDMGRSNRREFDSRLGVLLLHLLKWQFQSGLRSHSWSATIREKRLRLDKAFAESPSLRPLAPAMLPDAYTIAREHAIAETGLPDQMFPEECPFTLEQILAADFLPKGTTRKAGGATRRATR